MYQTNIRVSARFANAPLKTSRDREEGEKERTQIAASEKEKELAHESPITYTGRAFLHDD